MSKINTPFFIAGALATFTLLASGVFAIAPYVAFLSPIAALDIALPVILTLFVLSTVVIALSYKIISQNKTLDVKEAELNEKNGLAKKRENTIQDLKTKITELNKTKQRLVEEKNILAQSKKELENEKAKLTLENKELQTQIKVLNDKNQVSELSARNLELTKHSSENAEDQENDSCYSSGTSTPTTSMGSLSTLSTLNKAAKCLESKETHKRQTEATPESQNPKKKILLGDTLYNNKTTANNGVQTDGLKIVDKSIQIDLKPEVTEKESKVISKDREVQTEVSTEEAEASRDLSMEVGLSMALEVKRSQDLQEQLENVNLDLEIERLQNSLLQGRLESVNSDLEIECSRNAFLKRNCKECAETVKQNMKEMRAIVDSTQQAMKSNGSFRNKLFPALKGILEGTSQSNDQEHSSKDAELEGEVSELWKEKAQHGKQLEAMEGEHKTHKENRRELESQLSTAINEKNLGNDVTELQEQALEENKESMQLWKDSFHQANTKNEALQAELNHEMSKVERQECIVSERGRNIGKLREAKKRSDEESQEIGGGLARQERLVGQSQADIKRLQKEKNVDERLKDTDEKIKKSQGQTEAQKSTLPNLSRGFNGFLSEKNKELKKGFPEFKGKHFCHNVLDKTIVSLSNQGDGKFERSELLKLLENNLMKSARDIIDDVSKIKLSFIVNKLKKKFKIEDSGNDNNDGSIKLPKETVKEELAETWMMYFSIKIRELQLASSITDKFLSPDQKMCDKIPEKENMYQLKDGINKTNSMPSSFVTLTKKIGKKVVESVFTRKNGESKHSEIR